MLNLILNFCNSVVHSKFTKAFYQLSFNAWLVLWGLLFTLSLVGILLIHSNLHLFTPTLAWVSIAFDFARYTAIGLLVFKLLNSFIQCFRIQTYKEIEANRLKDKEAMNLLFLIDPWAVMTAKRFTHRK